MTKQDLVGVISYRSGIPQEKVGAVIDLLTENVKLALARGDTVCLRGFGAFGVKVRSPRKGRIIARNVTIDIPARRVVSFKPYPELEAMVAENEK